MNPIKEFAKHIEPYLAEVFEKEAREIPESLASAHQMLENIKDFCLRGGKRLRPALVYLGCKLLGKEDSPDIFKTAVVMELIHAFLLIQDDVMDQSTLRRQKLTIHKLYEKEAINLKPGTKEAKHFGESMGFLAGDLCCVMALKTLMSLEIEEAIKSAILKKINQTITQTIFGQQLELRLGFKRSSQPPEIIEIYRLKSGQYTFEAPLHIGAILAGAADKEFQKLSSYALPCGIAFQIKDDILGMFGKEQALGKPITSDLEQGKQTLLIALALKKGTEEQKQKLISLLGSKDLEQVRLIIKETGALADCQDIAKKYVSQAKQALKQFDSEKYNRSIVQVLDKIADFIIEREL